MALSGSTPDLSILTGGAQRTAPGGERPWRDYGIRIARDGTWYHNGLPFRRMALVKLFARVLQRADDGAFLLVTPAERGTVAVEDAPFVALEMAVDGEGQSRALRFRTNVDDWVTADTGHPIRLEIDPESGEPRPYVLVRPGLEALIVRAVFYDLIELADELADGRLAVWSGGVLHPLGQAAEA